MYKVAIIDDEIIFREHLRKTIDWKSNDFEICFEARNGVDALEKIKNNKPDIMLVDINMPFMDGLELATNVKEQNPEINIVLITGYSEFEYARKALKIGVKDYILKPFDKEELILTLIKIKNKLIQEKEEKKDEMREEIILKESLFNLLVNNEYEFKEEEIIKQLQKFNIETKTLLFRVSVIEIEENDDMEVKNHDIMRNAVTNILNERVKSSGSHISFYDHNGRIISLIEVGKNKDNDLDIEQYDELCYLVKKYLNIKIAVGVGKTYKGLNKIWTSYKEAIVAIQNKFILGNKVIQFETATTMNNNIGFYTSEVNETILINLRINEINKVVEELNTVFEFIKSNKVSVDYTYAISMGLISVCFSYIIETGNSIEKLFGRNFFPLEEIKKRKSMEDLKNLIVDLYQKVFNYTNNNNKLTRSKIIARDVKEFIDNNYQNQDLNIDRIAKAVYINSSYLRSIFKKELNLTVIEYLTNIRMQKAKELLQRGNLKHTEISKMIGYREASYFSKSFKKHFGVTPSEYENRIHK